MLEQRVTGDHLGDPETFLDENSGAARSAHRQHHVRAEPRGVQPDGTITASALVTDNRSSWTPSISSTISR